MIWVFTGGRSYKDCETFEKCMRVFSIADNDRILVGDCPTGLDKLIRDRFGSRAEIFVADWKRLQKAAGPARNAAMVSAAGSNGILVAFPGGSGTMSCVHLALKAGMTVISTNFRVRGNFATQPRLPY